MSGFEKFVAYEASAGSGKTFALSLRYISLLFLGNSPSKILTLTFTNKASNEMKNRIQNTLKNLEKKEFETELNELANITNLSKEQIFKKKDRVYREFLKQENYILTIDKFCAMVLRKFAFYVGLMPDFTIEQKDSSKRIILYFLNVLKKEGLYNDFIKFSIFEQKKLNSIFEIFYYFYEKFFTTVSYKKEIKFNEKEVWDSYNDLKKRILSCEKLSNRGKKSLELNSVEEIAKRSWFCKDSLGEYSDFKKCYSKEWDSYFGKLKEEIKRYFLYKESKYINNILRFFYIFKGVNEDIKKKIGDLSFLDISIFTYDILHKKVDKDFFYFRLDAKFDHILLDEFQDTSLLQFEILKPIFDEIFSGEGRGVFRSIFYVGDVKQSIYRFRGGSKELFYDIASRYNMGIKRLNVNYRSKKEIVEFVNRTFLGLMDGYFEQIPNDKNGGGYVEVNRCEDIANSVKDIVKRVLSLGIDEDDLAILTYTNDDALSIQETLKDEFTKLNISTQSSTLMINHHQVKCVIECMKYIYFGEDYYLQNLLALLGWSEQQKEKLDIFSKSLSPVDFAYKAMELFSLDSEVVLSFIDELSRYEDIEEFIFCLDDFKAQVPQKVAKGLKILTIHKSKGLEFKHLIVCDRIKRKSYDRSSFIIYEENLMPKDIYLKSPGRECVDSKYATIKEYEKRLSYEDELNAKYVAFTRAKESLFVLQKMKNSAFDDLELKEQIVGTFPKAKRKKDIVDEFNFEYKEPIVSRQRDIITLIESDEIERDYEAIEFGLATHYMLEMLDSFELRSIDKAYEAMSNKYLEIIGLQQSKEIRRRVENLIQERRFQELIKERKVYKELALKFKGELKQVDLLVQSENGYIVVDYKTSIFAQKRHKEQVKGYIQAISSISGKRTKGYLCYLNQDRIEIVEVKDD